MITRLAALSALALLAATPALAPEPPTPAGLFASMKDRYGRVGSYIARLTRREVGRSGPRPEELILVKVRERPWSVYAKWLGAEGKGREGVYVRGGHGDKVHTRLAAGDVPFVPAGRRMALAPDGAMMRAASTHPVTELGVGAAVERIGRVLAAGGREGSLAVVGPSKRPEFRLPAQGVEHAVPAGVDRAIPSGGKRTYWIDPRSGLPTLVVTTDASGREAEYYLYDRMQAGVKLDDADFDPDAMWGTTR